MGTFNCPVTCQEMEREGGLELTEVGKGEWQRVLFYKVVGNI